MVRCEFMLITLVTDVVPSLTTTFNEQVRFSPVVASRVHSRIASSVRATPRADPVGAVPDTSVAVTVKSAALKDALIWTASLSTINSPSRATIPALDMSGAS